MSNEDVSLLRVSARLIVNLYTSLWFYGMILSILVVFVAARWVIGHFALGPMAGFTLGWVCCCLWSVAKDSFD